MTLGLDLWLVPPPPAQAGIANFLIGGRRKRDGRSPNRRQGGGVRAGRLNGGFDQRLPYVITPRNTFQLSDQFPIRWQPVEGATTYTVRLWQWQDANGGRQPIPIWQTTTSDTMVIYGGAPPLDVVAFYAIEVITDQGVSSDLDTGCATAGFAVLFPETRSRLQTDLDALDRAALIPEELALAEAEIYLNYQMLDAAISTLETQLALTPTDTLYLALGDLYSLSGLNTLADNHYTQALALAATNRDELWQAVALEGLGEISVLRNDLPAALPYLRQAQLSYSLANVPFSANQIRDRIALLEKAQQLDIPPTDAPETCAPSP
jgi:hypothetical protein